jgi:hypothetical protein
MIMLVSLMSYNEENLLFGEEKGVVRVCICACADLKIVTVASQNSIFSFLMSLTSDICYVTRESDVYRANDLAKVAILLAYSSHL